MTIEQQPGTTLDGKYEVLSHLGGGGMGEVYLVRHIHLEEKRVVKILRADRVADPDAQKRFLREARFATQIKHAHVAILYDYSRLDDGSFYMVWEYIEGEDVGTRLRRNGPFPLRTALDLGMQALDGLNAIHGAGMIHRDVSPDNLMTWTDPRGRLQLKIIDLGLAKNLEPDPDLEVTQDGMFMGKLLYCAPEQAGLHKGETLDNRTDLYSLALVLYEMLCGRRPFEAETPQAAIFKRVSEDPLPLVGRNPAAPVPAELERVVFKALERERQDRYPDAVAFIEALRRVAGHLDRAATQEVPLAAGAAARAGRSEPAVREVGDAGGSRELSKAEKESLLAQIERAARRVEEGSKTVDQAEALLGDGRLDEVRELIARMESETPRARSLDALKERLAQAEALLARRRESEERDRLQAERQARLDEAEALITRYIQNKQLSLAHLALDTLLDLAPTHPKRGDFESWVALLADEVAQDRRADGLLEEGRRALGHGDFRAARRNLAQLQKADEELAAAFSRELAAAEREDEKSTDFREHQDRLEELIQAHEIEAAQEELKRLAALGAAKVTLDLYRSRLDEARASARDQAQVATFLEAFRERIDQGDFRGAREVAGELQRTSPGDPRPAELLAEVARLEREADRRRSIEQGEAQVERFLVQGDAAQAALALKLLLRMAPDHRKRKPYEKRIAKLKKG